MRLLLVSIALIVATGIASAGDAPKVEMVPVLRTNTTATGQPIVVPARPDVVVTLATFPPGARLPEHKHLYPHYAYVLSGVLTIVNTQTGRTFDIAEGQFLAEMQDTWHYGINNGKVPVKLLVIDQVPAGTKSNVVPKAP